jgi:hypothetical protein
MEPSPWGDAISCLASQDILTFYEVRRLLPYSQYPATGICPERNESIPYPHPMFLYVCKIHINIIPPQWFRRYATSRKVAGSSPDEGNF